MKVKITFSLVALFTSSRHFLKVFRIEFRDHLYQTRHRSTFLSMADSEHRLVSRDRNVEDSLGKHCMRRDCIMGQSNVESEIMPSKNVIRSDSEFWHQFMRKGRYLQKLRRMYLRIRNRSPPFCIYLVPLGKSYRKNRRILKGKA